ncbi:MAG: hypothetical protein HY791_34715 [Deltaproteobacteria bacterium]|nr:hypothetical protein [Deltaproteobacteria bacterium]
MASGLLERAGVLEMLQPAAQVLDTNRDGEIGEVEARAALRFADRNTDSVVDDTERRAFSHLLGLDNSLRAARAFTNSNMAGAGFRLTNDLAAVKAELQDATRALEYARLSQSRAMAGVDKHLGAAPRPDKSAAEIEAELAAIGTPAELAKRRSALCSSIPTLEKDMERLGAAAEKATVRVDRFPKDLDARISEKQHQIRRYEELLRRAPDQATWNGYVAELTARHDKLDLELRAPSRPRSDVQADKKAIGEELRFARSHTPNFAVQRLRSAKSELVELENRQVFRDRAIADRDAVAAKKTQAESSLRQAQTELSKVERDQPRHDVLSRQLAWAKTNEQHQAAVSTAEDKVDECRGRSEALGAESSAVEALRGRVNEVDVAGHERLRDADRMKSLTSRLDRDQAVLKSDPRLEEALKKTLSLRQIKRMVQEGKLDGDDVDIAKIDRDIKAQEERVAGLKEPVERTAKELASMLEDPSFQRSLDAMSSEERDELEAPAYKALAATGTGAAFYERNIEPVLKGDANAPDFFRRSLTAGGLSTTASLKSIEAFGLVIAGKGGVAAMALIDGGLARSLALNPAEWKTVRRALEAAKSPEDLDRVLSSNPALAGKLKSKLAGSFGLLGNTFGVLTGAAALVDAFKDPSAAKALMAAQGATDTVKILAKLGDSPVAQAFSKTAGRVAPFLDVVVGTYGFAEASKRGDTAGAIGNGMTALGGSLAAIGLGASASVVGAVAGVPLMIIGGIMSVAGSLVDWAFGDSTTEVWLHDNQLGAYVR